MLAAARALFLPENRSYLRNRILLPALGGMLVMVTVGYCFGYPRNVSGDDKAIDLSVKVNELKEPSMLAWKDVSIDGLKPDVFSDARIAMTIEGLKELVINDTGETGSVEVSLQLDDSGGLGAATIISHDGYLLTAEHCIDVQPITVLIKGKGRELVQLQPRIVWRGKASSDTEPDLALLHVERTLHAVFALGDESGLSMGAPVFSSGYCQFDESTCAGSIIRTPVAKISGAGVAWTRFMHDAPCGRGDSGGPVFGREGQLLGITAQANLSAWYWGDKLLSWRHRTISHRPDMTWLKQMMEKDRRDRKLGKKQKPAS